MQRLKPATQNFWGSRTEQVPRANYGLGGRLYVEGLSQASRELDSIPDPAKYQ